jgi:hypothetical protein
MTGNGSFHKNLESLKTSMNDFFEEAELNHNLMINSEEQKSEVTNILQKIEEYFMDLNHGTIDPAEVFDKRQELLEEVREYLYS